MASSCLLPSPSQCFQNVPGNGWGKGFKSSLWRVALEKMGWPKKVTAEGREGHWRWGQQKEEDSQGSVSGHHD